MKLYNDLPLSFWVNQLKSNLFCHKWGSVTTDVKAISFIIDRPDLYNAYLDSDFDTETYSDVVLDVYYAGRRVLERDAV